MKTITACKDCKDCMYFTMLDKFHMTCLARDKKYMYGQAVPCDDKKVGKPGSFAEDNVKNSEKIVEKP